MFARGSVSQSSDATSGRASLVDLAARLPDRAHLVLRDLEVARKFPYGGSVGVFRHEDCAFRPRFTGGDDRVEVLRCARLAGVRKVRKHVRRKRQSEPSIQTVVESSAQAVAFRSAAWCRDDENCNCTSCSGS